MNRFKQTILGKFKKSELPQFTNIESIEIRTATNGNPYFNATIDKSKYAGVSNNQASDYVYSALVLIDGIQKEKIVKANWIEGKIRYFANDYTIEIISKLLSSIRNPDGSAIKVSLK
tara:strand:+ start:225 stop:575 length:351 start_codon:yes stop_codon:yes gene_type:complete